MSETETAGANDASASDIASLIIEAGHSAIALILIAATAASAEDVAMLTHEANRVWCLVNGDASQPHWADAPDWQRQSALSGVAFHVAHPDASDSASHDNWMAEKIADGWSYGEVKDPDKKTHPCIVPFDQLPEAQQLKDRLFRTIVHDALIDRAPAGSDEADALSAATGRAAQLEQQVLEHKDRVTVLEGQLAQQAADRRGARVTQKVPSGKLRKIGAIAADKKPNLVEFVERLNEGNLELAFSDGKKEIAGLPPVQIHGNPWQSWSGRWRLTEPLILKGPGPNEAPYVVAGFGLFDAEGNQLDYSPLPDPVTVRPGQTVELKGSVIF